MWLEFCLTLLWIFPYSDLPFYLWESMSWLLRNNHCLRRSNGKSNRNGGPRPTRSKGNYSSIPKQVTQAFSTSTIILHRASCTISLSTPPASTTATGKRFGIKTASNTCLLVAFTRSNGITTRLNLLFLPMTRPWQT